MLQTARIPSAGKLRTVGWLQDIPYGMTPEPGSKDGCLSRLPLTPIVSLPQDRYDLMAMQEQSWELS